MKWKGDKQQKRKERREKGRKKDGWLFSRQLAE
jgi:hypothetical protein